MPTNLAKSLAPAELIAKNICPVKKEYVKGDLPRQYVDEVRSAAVSDTASDSKRKKQESKVGTLPQKDGLCFHYARKCCSFGDKCKFSHDMPSYLAQRPEDLPGSCPFSSQSECPYQVTCRWASKHKNPDNLTKDWLLPHLLKNSTADAGEGTCVPAAPASPVTSPTSAANKVPAPNSEPGANAASNDGAEKASNTSAEVTAIVDAGPAAGDSASRLTHDSPHAVCGDVATGTASLPAMLELPVSEDIQQPPSLLSHTLVHDLRKGMYNFDQADAQLSALGLSNNLQKKDRRPKNKRKGGAAAAPAAREGCTASTGPNSASAEISKASEAVAGGAGQCGSAVDVKPNAPAGSAAVNASHPTAAGPDAAPSSAASARGAVAGQPSGDAATAKPAPGDAGQPAAAGAVEAAAGSQQAAKKRCIGDGASPIPIYDISKSSNLEGGLGKRDGRPRIDFKGKLYCAPLTTTGNLPFRRIVKTFGCDVTCGEMALTANLLQGQQSEWALLKRHPSEDIFGVQICGAQPDSVARCVQLLDDTIDADFIDINMGCPIDLICNKGMGSAMLTRPKRMEHAVRAAAAVAQNCAITFKTRTGYHDKERDRCAAEILAGCGGWGAAAVTLHGRTRQQRYSRLADWAYVERCAECRPANVQLIGNGDVFSWEDYAAHMRSGNLATCMVARGALIKPWIFTEIKEERHWDISAGERLDMLKNFCSWGLQHWGSDSKGVETTRRFLLEWLSFLCRYVPVGLLEVVPQQMTWRPPSYVGRNDLETLMASSSAQDWVCISEMLLGPAPSGFVFVPKHKSNAYVGSKDAPDEVQG